MTARNPINILDQIRKYFGYGRLWPLWPVCKNHRAWFLAECNRPATSLHFQTWILAEMARITLCKTSLGPMGSGWLCQVLAKWTQSGSMHGCKSHLAHFWPMLLSQSGSDADWIRHVYWESSWQGTCYLWRISGGQVNRMCCLAMCSPRILFAENWTLDCAWRRENCVRFGWKVDFGCCLVKNELQVLFGCCLVVCYVTWWRLNLRHCRANSEP